MTLYIFQNWMKRKCYTNSTAGYVPYSVEKGVANVVLLMRLRSLVDVVKTGSRFDAG